MENKFSVQLSADDKGLIQALNNSKNKLESLQKSLRKRPLLQMRLEE